MDIFKRISHKNMKYDKKKSLVLIIAIAISTCLFAMVVTFMMGLIDAAEKDTIRQNGNYYIRMLDKENGYYNEYIKDRDVEHIARLYRIRKCYLRTDGEGYESLNLVSGDKKSLKVLNIVLEKGKILGRIV